MEVEVVGNSGGRRTPKGYRGVFVDAPEVVVCVVDEPRESTQKMARQARDMARRLMPKISGRTSRRLYPVSTDGVFGIWFPDAHVWFLERGISPFTMRSLAGKTIPMWVDDPAGEEQRKNPKIKTRVTEDGRQQVLIFRKAAPLGSRKQVWRKDASGNARSVNVPRSYPGAPGRIVNRTSDGRIAKANTGVRWRHTGTPPEGYLLDALTDVALRWNYPIPYVVATDRYLTGLRTTSDVSDLRTG